MNGMRLFVLAMTPPPNDLVPLKVAAVWCITVNNHLNGTTFLRKW